MIRSPGLSFPVLFSLRHVALSPSGFRLCRRFFLSPSFGRPKERSRPIDNTTHFNWLSLSLSLGLLISTKSKTIRIQNLLNDLYNEGQAIRYRNGPSMAPRSTLTHAIHIATITNNRILTMAFHFIFILLPCLTTVYLARI